MSAELQRPTRNPFGFARKKHQALLEIAARAGTLLEEYEYDHGTDSLIIRTSQDVQPIFDQNMELRNEGLSGDGYSHSRELRRAASIPLGVVHKWLTEEGLNIFDENHWAAIKRKLNDSEYLNLRTSTGRI